MNKQDTVILDFVDMFDKKNTKVVYIETLANPTLVLSDIAAIAEVVHNNKECMVIVDNTFLTPF